MGGLNLHYLDDLLNYLTQVLGRVVKHQHIVFKQTPVQQIFHLELYHVGAMLNHFYVLGVDFVLKQLVRKVNDAVQRCHHFVRDVGSE